MMDFEIVKKLKDLGAEEFDHINGSLLSHLQGTHDLLQEWDNRPQLCNAGLYHAVYGTAGLQQNLIQLKDRPVVASLIGEESEHIVYLFSACDRDYVYPQIGTRDHVEYRDRFSQSTLRLSDSVFADLCELTIANELEIARWRSADFLQQNCEYLKGILARMQPYVSRPAYAGFQRIFHTGE